MANNRDYSSDNPSWHVNNILSQAYNKKYGTKKDPARFLVVVMSDGRKYILDRKDPNERYQSVIDVEEEGDLFNGGEGVDFEDGETREIAQYEKAAKEMWEQDVLNDPKNIKKGELWQKRNERNNNNHKIIKEFSSLKKWTEGHAFTNTESTMIDKIVNSPITAVRSELEHWLSKRTITLEHDKIGKEHWEMISKIDGELGLKKGKITKQVVQRLLSMPDYVRGKYVKSTYETLIKGVCLAYNQKYATKDLSKMFDYQADGKIGKHTVKGDDREYIITRDKAQQYLRRALASVNNKRYKHSLEERRENLKIAKKWYNKSKKML